mmetsp:Transcript_9360/g.16123  ORF Transcript_9360/g.16123 Transcript_9360/m.16123 type:complete len:240 (+) Transcript_9360:68-787(+)
MKAFLLFALVVVPALVCAGYCPRSCSSYEVDKICRRASSVSCAQAGSEVAVSCKCGGRHVEARLEDGHCSGENNDEGQSCGNDVDAENDNKYCPSSCSRFETDKICGHSSSLACASSGDDVEVKCDCGQKSIYAHKKNGQCDGQNNYLTEDCRVVRPDPPRPQPQPVQKKQVCPSSCRRGDIDRICRNADSVACSQAGSIVEIRCDCGGMDVYARQTQDGCEGRNNYDGQDCSSGVIFG